MSREILTSVAALELLCETLPCLCWVECDCCRVVRHARSFVENGRTATPEMLALDTHVQSGKPIGTFHYRSQEVKPE